MPLSFLRLPSFWGFFFRGGGNSAMIFNSPDDTKLNYINNLSSHRFTGAFSYYFIYAVKNYQGKRHTKLPPPGMKCEWRSFTRSRSNYFWEMKLFCDLQARVVRTDFEWTWLEPPALLLLVIKRHLRPHHEKSPRKSSQSLSCVRWMRTKRGSQMNRDYSVHTSGEEARIRKQFRTDLSP